MGFDLHSLQVGGASAAAQAGVPDQLFRQHGRWKSETAKDSFVEESKENHLSASKSWDLIVPFLFSVDVCACVRVHVAMDGSQLLVALLVSRG